MFVIPYDVDRGVRRLLTAPRDLPNSISWQEPATRLSQASVRHQQLYREYVKSLNPAVDTAIEWWNGMIKARMERIGESEEEALEAVYSKRLAGPAARPEVVHVIRKYWLECVAVNVEAPEQTLIPPEVLLLAWLIEENQDLFVQVLAGMPYWPIGLSSAGDWI